MSSHAKLISAVVLFSIASSLVACKPTSVTIKDPLGLGNSGSAAGAVSAEIDLLSVQNVVTQAGGTPVCKPASFPDISVSVPGTLNGMTLTQPWKGTATITDANGTTPANLPSQIILSGIAMTVDLNDAQATLPQLSLGSSSNITMNLTPGTGNYTFPNTAGTLGLALDSAQVQAYLNLITTGGSNTIKFCANLNTDLPSGSGYTLKMPFASGTAEISLK